MKINSTEITENLAESSACIHISAKELARVANSRRKKNIATAIVTTAILVVSISGFYSGINSVQADSGARIGKDVTENYINDWPEMPSDFFAGKNSIAEKTAKAALKQCMPAITEEKGNTIPVVSKKSLIGCAAKSTSLHNSEIAYIKTELLNIRDGKLKADPSSIVRVGDPESPLISMQAKEFRKAEATTHSFVWYSGIGFNTQFSNHDIATEQKPSYPFQGKIPAFFSDYNGSVRIGFIYKNKWMMNASAGYYTVNYRQPATFVTEAAPQSRNLGATLSASRIFMFKNVGVKTGMDISAIRNNNSSASTASFGEGKWMYRPGIHVGLIGQLSPSMQLQFSPNAYYNTPASFKNKYSGPKPFGFGFDLSLHFRIR